MKAVILAGGSATRLFPVTQVINKHLLPIYNKPMIYYPLSLVMLAGIRDVVIVAGEVDIENYKRLLGDGSHLGASFDYLIQDAPKGLAHGLMAAAPLVEGDCVCLALGDNIFFGHGLPELLRDARSAVEKDGGACVFGYYVPDPERFGVLELDKDGKVVSIIEKPASPKSHYAAVGLYFYDKTVFEKARRIKPSGRGEYEITSVNEEYLKEGRLAAKLLGRGVAWFDAGTYDSFLEAGEFVATIERKTGLMIGCVEEISYRNGWIDKRQLISIAERLGKTSYGRYLARLADEE